MNRLLRLLILPLTVFFTCVLLNSCEKVDDEAVIYTVSFESNGGSTVSAQKVEGGSLATQPTAPTKDGHSFTGWYSDSALTSAWSFETPITADITLYAGWTTNTYTVSFETDGGSSVESQVVAYGGVATEPEAPTKESYGFGGWYSDEALTSAWNFSTTITADVTLYAKWTINTYAVSFEMGGGTSVETQYVEHGGVASEPTDSTYEGYHLEGWYTDEAFSSAWSFETPITADITIYANWEINTYTVSFETDGGTEIDSQVLEHGSKATQPSDPTRDGSTFIGWYSDEEYSSAWNFDSVVTADVTLYAKWNVAVYAVTFEMGSGSSVEPQGIEHGSLATEPTNSTYEGYHIEGWYTDAAFTTSWSFETPITASITLYAKWEINIYTVSFEMNGGVSADDQTLEHGALATEPTTKIKTGYTFEGWYSDAALTTAWSFSTAVTSNMTIYAKWTINTYTVSFEMDGGTEVSSQSVDYNNYASEPTSISKEGYTFKGWYSDAAFTTAWSFATPITATITIYAKWEINTYTVSFETNGGNDISAQSITHGSYASQPSTPTKTGYTFEGWYSDEALTTEWSFSTAVTGNATIYAKWISSNGELPDMGTGDIW